MVKISEHFSREDFACTCGHCNDFKMSLTVIGILEDLRIRLQTRINIIHGFLCDDAELKEPGQRKNYHNVGKAVDFTMEPKEKLIEAFRILETFPEITGLGFNPEESYIHFDLREKDPITVIYQRGDALPLTAELRAKYGLGDAVTKETIPASLTLELPVDIA